LEQVLAVLRQQLLAQGNHPDLVDERIDEGHSLLDALRRGEPFGAGLDDECMVLLRIDVRRDAKARLFR
jgi:hypothetical protein